MKEKIIISSSTTVPGIDTLTLESLISLVKKVNVNQCL